MSENQPKICVVCGEDCSNSPRAKDKQGNYICKACADKRRGAEGGKKPAPKEEDLMTQMVRDALVDRGEPCPECSAPMSAGAVVCTRCGYNRETGKAASTRVSMLSKTKKKKGKK
jgi:hypothetical protein